MIIKNDLVTQILAKSELIQNVISLLNTRTIENPPLSGDRDTPSSFSESASPSGEEEGVSVGEKNGALGIVLEIVEGGGWKGDYSELEEAVSRLEEEGEKEWRERRKKGGSVNGWTEWREMGRLARDVGWAIERKKDGGEGIATLSGMKKKLNEEKKQREATEKKAKDEHQLREEAELANQTLQNQIAEIEKKRKEAEDKLMELTESKQQEEKTKAQASDAITSLDALHFQRKPDYVTVNANSIRYIREEGSLWVTSTIGPELKTV